MKRQLITGFLVATVFAASSTTFADEDTSFSCKYIEKAKALGKITKATGGFLGKLTLVRRNSTVGAPAPFHAAGKVYLASSAEAERYLTGMSRKMLDAQEGGADIRTPAIYLGSERSYQGEAFFDDGIVINIGLLDAAKTDDEVAFVLAHELAHVILGHTSDQKSIKRSLGQLELAQEAIDYTAEIAGLAVGDAINISGAVTGDQANAAATNREAQAEIEEHNRKIAAIMHDFRELSEKIAHPAWTAGQEDQADTKAIEIMLRAGYSFYGVVSALNQMRKSQNQACTDLQQLENEVLAFRKQLESGDWALALMQGPKAAAISEALNVFKKKGKDALSKAVLAQAMPQTHRPWDERLEILEEYSNTDEISVLISGNPPANDGINRLRSTGSFQISARSAVAIDKFSEALRADNVLEASQQINAINMQTSQGRLFKRRLRIAQGRESEAFENLEIAFRLDTPALIVYEQLAAEQYSRGYYGEALSTANAGSERFSDPAHFLPELIYVTQTDDKAAASHASNLDGKALKKKCKKTPRRSIREICKAAETGISAEFRTATKNIIAAGGCKGIGCGGSLIKGLIKRNN